MRNLLMLLLFSIAILNAKEYPTLNLAISSIGGKNIHSLERSYFMQGLGHRLSYRGNIDLVEYYDAPYWLDIEIKNYYKLDPHKGTKHHYKANVSLKVYFWLKDRWDYELYRGSVDYNLLIDSHTSGRLTAYQNSIKEIFRGAGERVADRLNSKYRFLLDFQRQKINRYSRGINKNHKQNLAILYQGESLDFDSGYSGRSVKGADISWQGLYAHKDMKLLKFLGSTRYAFIPRDRYQSIGISYAKRVKLKAYDIFSSHIDVGSAFIIKTNQNRYIKMRVLGFKDSHSTTQYAIYLSWEFL